MVFEDLWNRRAQFPACTFTAETRNRQEWCARLSTESAAAEGANQVPSPVTPWQDKSLDEILDDDLDLDGDRLRKACMTTGTNKVLRMGVVPGRVWRSEAQAWHQREECCEGSCPAQQERSLQSRSPSSWRQTIWKSSTSWQVRLFVSGCKQSGW